MRSGDNKFIFLLLTQVYDQRMLNYTVIDARDNFDMMCTVTTHPETGSFVWQPARCSSVTYFNQVCILLGIFPLMTNACLIKAKYGNH